MWKTKIKNIMVLIIILLILAIPSITKAETTFEYGTEYYTYPSVTVKGLEEGKTYYSCILTDNIEPPEITDYDKWNICISKNDEGAFVFKIPGETYASYTNKVYLWVKEGNDIIIDGEKISPIDFSTGKQNIVGGGFSNVYINIPLYGGYSNVDISYKWEKLTDQSLIQKIKDKTVIKLSELGAEPVSYTKTVKNITSSTRATVELPSGCKVGEYYILWSKAEETGKRDIVDASFVEILDGMVDMSKDIDNNINVNTNGNIDTNANTSKDNTTATTVLPKTGETILSISFMIFASAALVGYINYKRLKDIK